jgi:acetate kinase
MAAAGDGKSIDTSMGFAPTADEDLMIARSVCRILETGAGKQR